MATIKKESFGKLSDGREVELYTLRNTKGTEVKVTTYGADGWAWAAEARGSWTPRLCKSTMDKEVIMKKTSKKNMMSIMGMIMNTGFFFILT